MNKTEPEFPAMQPEKSHAFLAVYDFGDKPDLITSQLGFPPSEAWCAGDPLPNHPTARRRHSRWVFKSPLPLQAHVDDHFDALLPLLEPFSSRIRELASRFPTVLGCALYYHRDFTPGIHLPALALQRIAALGIALDFDLYFLGGTTVEEKRL